MHARDGKRAQTILNNHRAKVFASGMADPETLRYMSEVVGEAEFRQQSETAVDKGRNSATEGSTNRKLAPANVVRGGTPGSALLVYGHLGRRGSRFGLGLLRANREVIGPWSTRNCLTHGAPAQRECLTSTAVRS